jgi:cysteine desulfurase / selenocysteine lyase
MMNIGLLRRETPACRDLIHFNNAGAALSPRPVTEAVLHHLMLEQRIGGYEAADASAAAQENFYHAFGRLLNCNPREIAYVENATRAWTLLLQAIPFEPGDRILTGQSEYASNYLALMHLAKNRHVSIDVVENDTNGQISLESLKQKIDTDVRLIALTHVPSQSGVIHPAAEVGKLARRHRIFYLLDACQSVGQLKLDVNEIGCDMLTGSGRKYLRGPRGTGFMYVRQSILDYLEPTSIDLHSASWTHRDTYSLREDARRFEIWEQFIAGKIGLGVAADYAVELGSDAIESRIKTLAGQLRGRLADMPGIQLHERGENLCGIVTFSCEKIAATELQQKLRYLRINTSVVRRQNTLLDFTKRNLADINRASVHYYNNDDEIERFCDALTESIRSA